MEGMSTNNEDISCEEAKKPSEKVAANILPKWLQETVHLQ